MYKNLIVCRSSNDSVHLTLEDNLVVIEALRNSASELAQSADISRSDKELLLGTCVAFLNSWPICCTQDGKNFDKQPFSLESYARFPLEGGHSELCARGKGEDCPRMPRSQ